MNVCAESGTVVWARCRVSTKSAEVEVEGEGEGEVEVEAEVEAEVEVEVEVASFVCLFRCACLRRDAVVAARGSSRASAYATSEPLITGWTGVAGGGWMRGLGG